MRQSPARRQCDLRVPRAGISTLHQEFWQPLDLKGSCLFLGLGRSIREWQQLSHQDHPHLRIPAEPRPGRTGSIPDRRHGFFRLSDEKARRSITRCLSGNYLRTTYASSIGYIHLRKACCITRGFETSTDVDQFLLLSILHHHPIGSNGFVWNKPQTEFHVGDEQRGLVGCPRG